jgi:hypothetical protein
MRLSLIGCYKDHIQRPATSAGAGIYAVPRTASLQWLGHIVLGIVALLLVMWMLRVFVL